MNNELTKVMEELKIPQNYGDISQEIKTGLLPFDNLKIFNTCGTFIQLVGETNCGKTSISLQVALGFCKQEKNVVYIDSEGVINETRLHKIGLSEYCNTNFFYVRENDFKEVETVLDKMIATGKIDLVIVDSLPGLINSGYLNLEAKGKKKGISIDNNNTNYESRPLGLFIHKYKAISSNFGVNFLLINGFRNKIDRRIGTIKKRFGVKTLDYSSTTILEICETIPKDERIKQFKDLFKDLPNGIPLCLKVIKSNVIQQDIGFPFFFEYGIGISSFHYLVYFLWESKLIIKSGTYYELKGKGNRINGLYQFIEQLKGMPELYPTFKNEMESYFKSD